MIYEQILLRFVSFFGLLFFLSCTGHLTLRSIRNLSHFQIFLETLSDVSIYRTLAGISKNPTIKITREILFTIYEQILFRPFLSCFLIFSSSFSFLRHGEFDASLILESLIFLDLLELAYIKRGSNLLYRYFNLFTVYDYCRVTLSSSLKSIHLEL